MHRFLFPILLAIGLPCSVKLKAQENKRIILGLGGYDFKRQDPFAVETRVEMRWGRDEVLKPLLGFSTTTRGTTYGYLGLYYDWRFSKKRNVYLIPSFALGHYHQGGGKDLGCFLEFRSQVELAYEFSSGIRASLALGHTSNARQAQLQNGKENPGCEHLFLGVSIPLEKK